MKQERLGNIIEITKGKKVTNVGAHSLTYKHRYIQIEDLRHGENLKYTNESNLVEVNGDDLIIAWDGANAGTIGYNLSGIIGSTLARLRIKNTDEIHPFYLGLFLQSRFQFFKDRTTGATIPHIDRDSLENISVPIVSLDSQRQIVTILDKAQSIIDKRKSSLQLLDQLLQDTFLDMFGDPVNNSKKWRTFKLLEVGSLDRGVSKNRPRNAPELLGGPYPLVQTGDISNANVYVKKYSSTYSELGLRQSKMWPKGTLCITIAANIGRTGILNFDACFPDSVVGFIPNEKTNSEFVHFWFLFWQKILENNAPQVAQKNINLEILRDLKIISPPVALQNNFKKIVQHAELIREKLSLLLIQSETLFQSVLQKAFKGELEINTENEEIPAQEIALQKDLPVLKPLELKKKTSVPLPEEKPQIAESSADYVEQLKTDLVTVGDRNIYLTQFVKEQGLVNFTLATLSRRFQEVLGATILMQQLKESIYSVIDHFIIAELLEQPFTFQQLKSVLADTGFSPSFDILNEYIFSRLEGKNPLLKQAYFDEQMSSVNATAYQYLRDIMNPNLMLQDAFTPPRRLFLVSALPKIKIPHAT